MARSTFGGGIADWLFEPVEQLGRTVLALPKQRTGQPWPPTVTVWDAAIGGNRITDLLVNGSAATELPVDATGQISGFQGPDGVSSVWLSAGGGRVRLDAPGAGGGGSGATWSTLPGKPSTFPPDVEAVQDAVAALLQSTSGITLSYDDAANTLTITGGGAGGLDAEAVRDTIGVALIGTGLISVVVNDAADTITITTTATANSTDAQLRDRTTHTGLTPLSGVAAGSTISQASTDSARATNRTDVTVIAKGGSTPPAWLLAGDLHFASA